MSSKLVPVVDPKLQDVADELAETFERAGLMPLAALDLAEQVVGDRSVQKRLRWITGDLLIFGGMGLQGSDQ